MVSPPSPKLELGPEPAPTVPASRSDFKTFDPDAAGAATLEVAAFGVQTELNLLLPTSMGRSSFDDVDVVAEEDSPQTLRTADGVVAVVGSCCSGIIQIEPSDAGGCGSVADLGVEFSQMLGEKLGDCGCWDGSRTAVAQGLAGGGGEVVLPVVSGDDLAAGGLSGGPPQSDLLPQMAAFSCGCGCG